MTFWKKQHYSNKDQVKGFWDLVSEQMEMFYT